MKNFVRLRQRHIVKKKIQDKNRPLVVIWVGCSDEKEKTNESLFHHFRHFHPLYLLIQELFHCRITCLFFVFISSLSVVSFCLYYHWKAVVLFVMMATNAIMCLFSFSSFRLIFFFSPQILIFLFNSIRLFQRNTMTEQWTRRLLNTFFSSFRLPSSHFDSFIQYHFSRHRFFPWNFRFFLFHSHLSLFFCCLRFVRRTINGHNICWNFS